MSESDDLHFMRLALAEAAKCEPTPTAFCVGCIITVPWPSKNPAVILSTGYSRQLPGNTHAEANALENAYSLSRADLESLFPFLPPETTITDLLALSDVYTTLEPCSVRNSGLAPCADALITAKINRCFTGVAEPTDFVVCEGTQRLRDAGIQVIYTKGLEAECLEAARRGH